jgi:hypothetical protein
VAWPTASGAPRGALAGTPGRDRPPGLPDAVARTAAWLTANRTDDPSAPNWPNAVPLPNGSADPVVPARSAWCYGAPGVAAALWLAGRDLAAAAMSAALTRPAEVARAHSPTFCTGGPGCWPSPRPSPGSTGDGQVPAAGGDPGRRAGGPVRPDDCRSATGTWSRAAAASTSPGCSPAPPASPSPCWGRPRPSSPPGPGCSCSRSLRPWRSPAPGPRPTSRRRGRCTSRWTTWSFARPSCRSRPTRRCASGDRPGPSRNGNAGSLDPEVRRALAVASPSLLAALDRAGPGDRGSARLEGKLLRYLIRMSTRPTPFGLFAGVGIARWADRTDLAVAGPPRRGPGWTWSGCCGWCSSWRPTRRFAATWACSPTPPRSSGAAASISPNGPLPDPRLPATAPRCGRPGRFARHWPRPGARSRTATWRPGCWRPSRMRPGSGSTSSSPSSARRPCSSPTCARR